MHDNFAISLATCYSFCSLLSGQLLAEFDKRGADAVFAFQLRNPIHNGHALLMQVRKKKTFTWSCLDQLL